MVRVRSATLAAVLSAQNFKVVIADATCWEGAFAHMRAQCCLDEDPNCWDAGGSFTWDRCCLDLQPPGDPECFPPDTNREYNYYTCCERQSAHCFDAQYTFRRCCGGDVAVLRFTLQQSLQRWYIRLWQVRPIKRPWMLFAAFAMLLRFVRFVQRDIAHTSLAMEDNGKVDCKRKIDVPAAAVLRVVSTCGIVAFHSLGNCGHSRKCDFTFIQDASISIQLLSSFFVLHTDVFFVLSAYLVVAGESSASQKSLRYHSVRETFADFAAAILRRVLRTAPTFILSASFCHYGMVPFLSASWPGHVLGITYPLGKPMTWPFGVELLCLAVLQGVLLLQKLAGRKVSLTFVVGLLAICLERRRQKGADFGDSSTPGQHPWHVAHVAIASHRLPLCLATLLITVFLSQWQTSLVDAILGFQDCSRPKLRRALQACWIAFAWVVAAAGMAMTTALEWCWNFGPKILLPWWLYPFPAKLPLLLGCVSLLEISRRCALLSETSRCKASIQDTRTESCSTGSTAEGVVQWLERRSLGVLVMHEFVEHVIVTSLQPYPRDITMFWFELPAVLAWSYAVASFFVWVEQPYRSILDGAMNALRRKAVEGPNAAIVFTMLAAVTGILWTALRQTCSEPILNPCQL